jgi:hypothetical protein
VPIVEATPGKLAPTKSSGNQSWATNGGSQTAMHSSSDGDVAESHPGAGASAAASSATGTWATRGER